MDHLSLVRPNMPGTTPALQGGKSVYGSSTVPHFEDGKGRRERDRDVSPADREARKLLRTPTSTRELIRSTSAKQRQRILQEKTLSKIVTKLPYDLRETVTAVLTMAFSTSENIQKDLDVSHQESMVLKSELTKKIGEIHTLQKAVDIYKSQIVGLEGNIETLKDNIDSRQKFSLKHRSAMTRLATTNRMLIDALDALEASGGSNLLGKNLSNQSTLDEQPAPGRVGQLAPLAQSGSNKNPKDHKEYEEKMKNIANSQNEKLRESLLKIAREHYRSMKNVEHLEAKVGEMKLSLRQQEQINRNLKTELDELKMIHLADAQAMEDNKSAIDGNNMNFKGRSFGVIDERFKAMLERNLFDPIDGIQQLRRILAHMATAPTTLSLTEMISHIVSKDSIRIFGAEMICLYLIKPGSENIMHKFTARSPVPISYDLSTTKSLAADTIRKAKVFRMNNLGKCANYSQEIDGCTGVLGRRILSLPLINTQHNMVIGAVEIINKGANNDVFAEIDEIFGLIFAYQTSLLLTSCVMYDALFFHSQLLRGLLEASTDLYAIIPEASSLAYTKSLSPSEVIMIVERTARDLLKCPNVRAFLVSDWLSEFPAGQFIYIQPGTISNYHKIVPNAPLKTAPLHSGIVGFVHSARQYQLSEAGNLDPYWNPTVDMDPLTYSMMTVPIMDLNGTIMCCLQLLIGNKSPRLKPTDDPNDFRIFFGQAAEWLCHQLASPLKYLLDFIGRPAYRPVSTPSRISKPSADGSHRPSFFASGQEVVTQIFDSDGQNDEKFNQFVDEDTFQSISLKEIQPSAGDSFYGGLDSTSPTMPKAGVSKRAFEEEDVRNVGDRKVRFHNEQSTTLETEQLAILEAKHAQMSEELTILHESLDKSKEELSTLVLENEQLKVQVSNLERHKEDTDATIRSLQQDKELLEKAVSTLSESGSGQEQKLLDMANSLEYSNQLINQKDKEIESLISASKEWKAQQASYAEKEKSLGNQVADLQDAIQAMNNDFAAANNQQSTLSEEVQSLQREKTQQKSEIDRLLQVVNELQVKIAEKDKVQSILQDQIVKLANQNIEKIDQAISKPQPISQETSMQVAPSLPKLDEEASSNSSAASKVPTENILPAIEQEVVPEPYVENQSHDDPSVDQPQLDQVSSVLTEEQSASVVEENHAIDAELPAGWCEMKDDFGRVYFYNQISQESSWTDPRLLPKNSNNKVTRGEWDQYFDDNGTEYWVNRITGQSSWSIPAEEQNSYADDVDEEDLASHNRRKALDADGFGTNASQYSISAGDYTIEL